MKFYDTVVRFAIFCLFLLSPQTVSNGAVCLRKFHWLLHNILIINIDKFLQRGWVLKFPVTRITKFLTPKSCSGGSFGAAFCIEIFGYRDDSFPRSGQRVRKKRFPATVCRNQRGEMKNIVSDYLLSNLIYRKFATSFSMVWKRRSSCFFLCWYSPSRRWLARRQDVVVVRKPFPARNRPSFRNRFLLFLPDISIFLP